jgi:hypothetical protein
MIKIKKINFFVQKKQLLSHNKDMFYMFTCFILIYDGFLSYYMVENSNLRTLCVRYRRFKIVELRINV